MENEDFANIQNSDSYLSRREFAVSYFIHIIVYHDFAIGKSAASGFSFSFSVELGMTVLEENGWDRIWTHIHFNK